MPIIRAEFLVGQMKVGWCGIADISGTRVCSRWASLSLAVGARCSANSRTRSGRVSSGLQTLEVARHRRIGCLEPLHWLSYRDTISILYRVSRDKAHVCLRC